MFLDAPLSSSVLDFGLELGPEKQLDMLEIPGKGRCYVFLAR